MSNQKQVYYNIDRIDQENALFNVIYGERSGGKSFQAKHKKGIIPYLESIIKDGVERDRFVLMRRYEVETKTDKIEDYFKDVDIASLTDNKYNSFEVFKKRIYLLYVDPETGKKTKGDYIGYVVPLNMEQHYAGGSYLDVKNIIFEEFISRKDPYLADEPNKFLNFWNTVDRKRGIVRCWLLGNSISRICPYFPEWGLMDIVKKQKIGTIISTYADTGSIDEETGETIKIKIAIEYCDNSAKQGITFGTHANMMNRGEWQSDPQPCLPKSRKEYTKKFAIGFQFNTFKFMGELLQDPESKNLIWFIYPHEKEFKKKLLIISDTVKSDIYYQRDIYNPTIKNERLKEILNTFRESNIFYSDDLTGTDFKQAIDFTIKK